LGPFSIFSLPDWPTYYVPNAMTVPATRQQLCFKKIYVTD